MLSWLKKSGRYKTNFLRKKDKSPTVLSILHGNYVEKKKLFWETFCTDIEDTNETFRLLKRMAKEASVA